MILALAGQFKQPSHEVELILSDGDSTGFEPMTSAMPVQCSNQLSYEDMILARAWGHGFESRWVTWIFQVHETIA